MWPNENIISQIIITWNLDLLQFFFLYYKKKSIKTYSIINEIINSILKIRFNLFLINLLYFIHYNRFYIHCQKKNVSRNSCRYLFLILYKSLSVILSKYLLLYCYSWRIKTRIWQLKFSEVVFWWWKLGWEWKLFSKSQSSTRIIILGV